MAAAPLPPASFRRSSAASDAAQSLSALMSANLLRRAPCSSRTVVSSENRSSDKGFLQRRLLRVARYSIQTEAGMYGTQQPLHLDCRKACCAGRRLVKWHLRRSECLGDLAQSHNRLVLGAQMDL